MGIAVETACNEEEVGGSIFSGFNGSAREERRRLLTLVGFSVSNDCLSPFVGGGGGGFVGDGPISSKAKSSSETCGGGVDGVSASVTVDNNVLFVI